MSVKILNKKSGYNAKTCDKCGAVFSYDKDDISRSYSAVSDWWGDNDPYSYYIKCPKCGNEINL